VVVAFPSLVLLVLLVLLVVVPLQALHNRLANGSLPAPTKLITAASTMSPAAKHMMAVHPCVACWNSWLPMIGPTGDIALIALAQDVYSHKLKRTHRRLRDCMQN
jgi:hypothetical protein